MRMRASAQLGPRPNARAHACTHAHAHAHCVQVEELVIKQMIRREWRRVRGRQEAPEAAAAPAAAAGGAAAAQAGLEAHEAPSDVD